MDFQWRNRNLTGFIKNILIFISKMNERLMGAEWNEHESHDDSLHLGWTIPLKQNKKKLLFLPCSALVRIKYLIPVLTYSHFLWIPVFCGWGLPLSWSPATTRCLHSESLCAYTPEKPAGTSPDKERKRSGEAGDSPETFTHKYI